MILKQIPSKDVVVYFVCTASIIYGIYITKNYNDLHIQVIDLQRDYEVLKTKIELQQTYIDQNILNNNNTTLSGFKGFFSTENLGYKIGGCVFLGILVVGAIYGVTNSDLFKTGQVSTENCKLVLDALKTINKSINLLSLRFIKVNKEINKETNTKLDNLAGDIAALFNDSDSGDGFSQI